MKGIGITGLAFVGYPVTDFERAFDFYERILGLERSLDHEDPEHQMRWVEFDLGDQGTLAISDAWPPTGQSGPTAAVEVADLDSAIERLRSEGVTLKSEVMSSPSCRFFVIADPDGNDLTIHQHNPS